MPDGATPDVPGQSWSPKELGAAAGIRQQSLASFDEMQIDLSSAATRPTGRAVPSIEPGAIAGRVSGRGVPQER